MVNVLMILSAADHWTLKDGSQQPEDVGAVPGLGATGHHDR